MNKSGKRIGEKRGANRTERDHNSEGIGQQLFRLPRTSRIPKVNTHNEMIGSDKRTAPRNRKRQQMKTFICPA